MIQIPRQPDRRKGTVPELLDYLEAHPVVLRAVLALLLHRAIAFVHHPVLVVVLLVVGAINDIAATEDIAQDYGA